MLLRAIHERFKAIEVEFVFGALREWLIFVLLEARPAIRHFRLLSLLVAELSRTNTHRVEFHLVAGQRASFVSKDVMKGTEVFNNTNVSYFGRFDTL